MFIRASLFRAVAVASAVCVVAILATDAAFAGVERVPINAQGQPIGEHLGAPALSHDGRFLVFQSTDEDLVPDDDNGVSDVFVYDYETNELVRASGAFLATFGAGHSVHPAISADERFVVFASDSNALNLPIAVDQTIDVIDSNLARDIFVYDRDLRQTTVVSVQTGGALLDGESDYPSISRDGRFVVFQSRASTPNEPGGAWRIFVHDRSTGETRVISVDENGRSVRQDSERPVISADGRYVAFESDAALVRDDRNGRRDIYRYDLREGVIELVSVSSTGEIGSATSRNASINANGSMIAFESAAGNLVDGDTNLVPDIFVRDMDTRSTHRVSVGSDGQQSDGSSANAAISADGSTVVFESYAQNITPRSEPPKPEDADQNNARSSVYLHQMLVGRTLMIAEDLVRTDQTRSGDPTISGDGTTMAFNEMPLFEPPGGTIGGVGHGELWRVGTCQTAPDFAVAVIEVDGVPQVIGAIIMMLPRADLFIRLEALDTLPCGLETMRIRLQSPGGGSSLPVGMTFIQDSDDCTGHGSAPITSGVLATADDDADINLAVSLCWTPEPEDVLVNGGNFTLEFVADFPGSLQPTMVLVRIQVLECNVEIDLDPDFTPGFTSGAVIGQSQFDLDGIGGPDFLSSTIMGSSNRWLTLLDPNGEDADIDVMTLVVSDVATFDFSFGFDESFQCGSIEELDVEFIPNLPFNQDPIACMPGSTSSAPFPCFLTVDNVVGFTELGTPFVLINPVYPLTLGQFQALPGWPADAELRTILLRITVAPTALDMGIHQVLFRLRDTTNHISDPQVDFNIVGCFEPPCCDIDQYQIKGVDGFVRDIPTEQVDLDGPGPEPPLTCAGNPVLQPAGDGIIDVFPNQTVSFVVNGRLAPKCPGGVLTLEKDEQGGDVFPAGVMCIDMDGAGTDYVCFGDPGAPDSEIKTFIEWMPTTADIQVDPYILRFNISDNTGRISSCLVRIRVCPEPVCAGEITINGVTTQFVPAGPGSSPSFTVTPGDVVSILVTGTQDCGEFTGVTVLDPVYRTITIQPDQNTCGFFCNFGCSIGDPSPCPVDSPYDCVGISPVCSTSTGFDDPNIDDDNADGDGSDLTGFDDPFSACVFYEMCIIPELEQQETFDLCFQIIDASGKQVDCCLRLIVCPPVTCEVSDVVINGTPAPSFDPLTQTALLDPTVDSNLQFKITAGGGCDNGKDPDDVVEITAIDIICLNAAGEEITIPPCEKGDTCCTLDGPCLFSETLPFSDGTNMPMVTVTCTFGCDWFALCDKIEIIATVTTDPGGDNEQTTTCSVMIEIGQIPAPVCTITSITVDGLPFDFIGMEEKPNVPLNPGDVLVFIIKGTIDCARPDLDLILDCTPLPSGAVVVPDTVNPIVTDCVTMRSWTITWTPTVGEFCNEKVNFVCDLSVFVPGIPDISEGIDTCRLNAVIGSVPPTCELSDFMLRPNPDICFTTVPDEELPFQDLPVDMVDDGYKVHVFPGDTIKLTFCGFTACDNSSLTLDAMGLPAGAIITCLNPPCDFPHSGAVGESPLCVMVEFVVPPTASFHITFKVTDSTGQMIDCVLWVNVQTVCNDFEPNDECGLPQTIVVFDEKGGTVCGPYLSGLLEERVTPGCQPDTFLVLFSKQLLNVPEEIINADNNSSMLGNGKASALFDITAANGLSAGNGSDLWLRIGVTGYPDGLVQPFNGFPQNGPHGKLGEFQMTVTFFDALGEIISPAIVQDASGQDVVIANPFVYTNEFITGAEAFRINLQAPREFQGSGVTVSASIEIDNTTGLDPLCDDVDFFKYVGLVPMTDYCITAVGGLSKDCTPINLQLGWFDKSCVILAIDFDSGPSGVAMLCVVSDINGEIIIGVTGKGDDDFDGYLTPPVPAPDGRAVNGCPDPSTDHGVCGCYTLCVMSIDPHTGALVDRAIPGVEEQAMVEAMRHGDMNMDGRTDTADLGMLMGRFGWRVTDGAAPAAGADKTKNPTPGAPTTLSGALED